MRVLGIMGSPRKGGNTDTLLDKALEGAASKGAEIEKIVLEDLNIAPCTEEEYGKVTDEGFSVVNDDIQVVFQKLKESDALILASPIFFGSLSAQMKTMIDRFQCVWWSENVLKKKVFTKRKTAALICASGTPREDFFDNAEFIARMFFATVNADCKDKLFCPGLEEKSDASKNADFLEKAFELGKNVANL